MNRYARLVNWTSLLVVAVFVALVFAQASKRFVLDEVDFPVLAKAIMETGLPYHYRGESDPASIGLWHPPLYAYALALFVKIFGFSEGSVRAFGMFCTLATAGLCVAIHRQLFPVAKASTRWFVPIFLLLFLLHPYTIANSTVPDIDTTVMPVTMLAFILVLLEKFCFGPAQARTRIPYGDVLFLAAFFALNLWVKMTTPIALIPLAFVLLALSRRWSLAASAAISALVALAGTAAFVLTYGLYCLVAGLPFGFVFGFLAHSFTKNNSSGGGLSALMDGVLDHLTYGQQFVNWVGLPFLAAIFFSCGVLLFNFRRALAETILLVLAGFALFISIFYLGLTGAFGSFFKYPFATFGLLTLVVAHCLAQWLPLDEPPAQPANGGAMDRLAGSLRGKLPWALAAVAAVLAAGWQVFRLGDVAIFQDRPVSLTILGQILAAALVASALLNWRPGRVIGRYLVVALLAVVGATSFVVSRIQAKAAYPTKYHYGQTGFDETVSYLHEHAAPGEPIWAMKDIGHYATGRYYENYMALWKPGPEVSAILDGLIRDQGVRYFVVTRGVGQDRVDVYGGLKEGLDHCCHVEKTFGNFVIYRANSDE